MQRSPKSSERLCSGSVPPRISVRYVDGGDECDDPSEATTHRAMDFLRELTRVASTQASREALAQDQHGSPFTGAAVIPNVIEAANVEQNPLDLFQQQGLADIKEDRWSRNKRRLEMRKAMPARSEKTEAVNELQDCDDECVGSGHNLISGRVDCDTETENEERTMRSTIEGTID